MRYGLLPGRAGDSFWLHDLFLLLIVIVIVAGIYLLVRGFTVRSPRPWGDAAPGGRLQDDRHRRARHAAVDELDLRYARGELDREDYLQRRADLLGGPPPPAAGGAAPGASPKI